MGLFRYIKKLIFGAPPPAKFLTPDGRPPEDEKTAAETETVAPATIKKSGKPVILYVVTKSNFGGAQQYVYDLATNAPPEYEAVVLCGTAHDNIQEGTLVTKLTHRGVRTIVIPELKRDLGLFDVKAVYQLYKAIQGEAPYILHLNSSKAGGLGALAGRVARVPKIIFTSHGWPFHEKRNPAVTVLIWLASVATILLSHKVICVSAYDRNAFRSWFFGGKLVTIHNALSPKDYLDREDARKDLVPHSGLFENDVWVGSIAELHPNKNITVALKAVANALAAGCNIFYAIVGDGEERLKLEDEARELRIDQNVRFLGFVSDAGKFIKAFDIALLPSVKEGLPYFALESARAKIPMIASNIGGIPEIIRDGENGLLVPPNNVEAFSAALVRLCKNQELRIDLSHSEASDSFETMLRETFAAYA